MNAAANLVFMGTPEFAVPALRKLHEKFGCTAVITQADKPAGRGMKLAAPPVKVAACKLGIRCFQPKSIKGISINEAGELSSASPSAKEMIQFLNALHPLDAFVVAAYGKIIPPAFMDKARVGVINIHPSLLPRWRGAAPIQHALFAGDSRTGVVIMQTDEGLDTGDYFGIREIPIHDTDTAGSLHDKLAELGGDYLAELLPQILAGRLSRSPQSEAAATYATKWERSDTIIKWQEPVEVIWRRIRASAPSPGARAIFRGKSVKILSGAPKILSAALSGTEDPGTIVLANPGELLVRTGQDGLLSIESMQFPGKRVLPVREFLKGHAMKVGERFMEET